MFIRNSWYVAAWTEEVGRQPLARTILNQPITLFRTNKGVAVALENRCAHRRMPLSNAHILDDVLVCCYHGLTYDFSGKCVRIPGAKTPPENIRVRSYPVIERYGAVWIWMGDPAQADQSNIFECGLLNDKGTNGQRFYFHVKANYLYLNDNLSDLLHQAYLHNPSFGGNTDPLGETRPTVSEANGRIIVRWDWLKVPAPGTFAAAGGIAGLADGWNYSTFQPPSFYINSPGFADAGTGGIASPRAQGEGKLSFTVYQLITPEAARTTHFFKIVHCDWPAEMLPKLDLFIGAVNREDIWACEEQQKMEDLDSAAPMNSIPTDTPVIKMRQMLHRLWENERLSPMPGSRTSELTDAE